MVLPEDMMERNHKERANVNSSLGRFTTWLEIVIYDTWYIEILFYTVSVVGCVLMGIILWVFNDKIAPVLPHDLTVNAVIAVLAAASKSAVILVIASSIGQLVSSPAKDLPTTTYTSRNGFGSNRTDH